MKKVFINQPGGGELANQLWNYASIYAYSLEKKYELINYSFYEYGLYFNLPTTNSLINWLFFKPFKENVQRKFSLKKKLWRKIYSLYSKIIGFLNKNRVINSNNPLNHSYSLPPSNQSNQKLTELEKTEGSIYFDGWLFRNPVGMEKYREEILEYFKPKKETTDKVNETIKVARTKYDHLVGIHVRQGDYKTWKDGNYFIEQDRIRAIIDEYLVFYNQTKANALFIITSDGKIDEKKFQGLNYFVSKNNFIEDLFLLASTDIILGSDSSFGDFAAYYGNIPHVIFKKEALDWQYYKDKKSFFENKYCTMVHY